MKKVKGSALLWCLLTLVIVAIITVTAVGIAVSYYKTSMSRAGNIQAYYNAESAANMIRDQLCSEFGGKPIYFTYLGENMLDRSKSKRNIDISNEEEEYYGLEFKPDSKDKKYFTAVRTLESELVAEYLENAGTGERKPIRISFNYGRIDTTVYNHGYYGDTADIYIESLKEATEPVNVGGTIKEQIIDRNGDGKADYYVAVVKAVSTLNTGFKNAVGAKFTLNPVRFDADDIPAMSVRMLDIGISDEQIPAEDPVDDPDELFARYKFKNANGILLSIKDDITSPRCTNKQTEQFALMYGDASITGDIKDYGYIRTDGRFGDDGFFSDEVSYLDRDAFNIINGFGPSAFSQYVINHSNSNLRPSPAFAVSGRNPDMSSHEFSDSNIDDSNEAVKNLQVCYELPAAITSGDRSNNRAKRYFVAGGTSADTGINNYYSGSDGKEFTMSFSDYVTCAKNNSLASGDSGFMDIYNTNSDIICCTVEEQRANMGGLIDLTKEIPMNDIKLESNKTYFFRICQNTRMTFNSSCYTSENMNTNVYFQLCSDKELGIGDYGIELKLVNPPKGVNFYAFDHVRNSSEDGEDICGIKPESSAAAQKNVTIIYNENFNDLYRHIGVSDKKTVVNGWFSCYMLSVKDETVNEINDPGERMALNHISVSFNTVKPKDYITIFNDDGRASSSGENKSYVWEFDRFVPVDTEIK